jgi:subtilisin family serine protease
MKRWYLVLAVILCGVLFCSLVLASEELAATGPFLRLGYGVFDPLVDTPLVPAALQAPPDSAGAYTYHIVQFSEPIQPAWRDALVAQGAEIMDYIPDYAYLVRTSAPGGPAPNAELPLRWVGPYQPAYKLAVELQQARMGPTEVDIQIFPSEPVEPVLERLREWDAYVSRVHVGEFASYVRALVPPSALIPLANLSAVSWIEPYFAPDIANSIGRAIMAVNPTWQQLGLYGAGQIVAVTDTGLGCGNASRLHADFAGRLLKAYALGRPPSDWSDIGGHGTHVAGSVLGNGSLSGSNPAWRQYQNSFAGVAPEAYLVFQSVKGADGSFSAGIPNDLSKLFRVTYGDGARVHTNSWGGKTGGSHNTHGGYVSGSRQVDAFIWNHKDMTILYSTGNDSVDADQDGVVDLDSIQWPATAKNAITIGATESVRSSGGYNRNWGEIWPDDYPARPIKIDHASNDSRGMAAFSGRGPTDDGRIKPDVVAPGSNIISTRAQTGDAEGWGIYDAHYIYMGGTSMATPLTAGAAALIRERYVQAGQSSPSAALVKGTLINGAEDISPGQYPIGPCQEVPDRTPNFVSGWGRVNVARAVAANYPRWIMYADEPEGLQTGGLQSYLIALSSTPQSVDLKRLAPLDGRKEPDEGTEKRPQTGNACSQYLQDTGFEAGGYAWGTQGDVYLSEYAHAGAYSAWLGGVNNSDDWIWQTMFIPQNVTRVTLSFWHMQDSEEKYCGWDYFWIGFYDAQWRSYLTELLWQDGRATTSGWVRKEITLRDEQLDAIRGRQVHLAFQIKTDHSGPSGIRLDDVYLSVCTGAADAVPIPLRVTLTWSDYPASLSAAKTLVNDLDLEIIDPLGNKHHGNSRRKPDRLNPVEDIILPNPPPGRYQIHVRGHNVAMGPQPFALVVSGGGSSRIDWRTYQYFPLVEGGR